MTVLMASHTNNQLLFPHVHADYTVSLHASTLIKKSSIYHVIQYYVEK